MNHLTPICISIRSAGNVVSRSSSQNGFLVGILALVCFALTSTVRAVTPAPDGIGFEALLSQQPSQFVFKDASGKATSVDVVETYQPKKIVRPFAKIDRQVDPKLMRAATIAEERAHAHSRRQCWAYVKEALLASGVIRSRPTTAYAKQAGQELVNNFGFRIGGKRSVSGADWLSPGL